MATEKASCSSASTAASQVSQGISPAAVEWMRIERKISAATLAKMPVASGSAFFGELRKKATAIYFRYDDGWKARSFPEKAFKSSDGFSPTFWNLDAVLNGPLTDVYIVEGEMDALAMVEAGVPVEQVLAAPSASANSPLEYVVEAMRLGLSKAKRYIWCGDSDAAGIDLRSNMRRVLGLAKFHFVDWPDGAKDANAFLKSDGAAALLDRLDGLLPWPSEGIYTLFKIPDATALPTWDVEFTDGIVWSGKMALAPGTLSVVTGHPGHGKTLLWTQLWWSILNRYGLVMTVASFEQRVKPHLRRQLRQLICKRLEGTLSDEELNRADVWINDHYRFLQHPERRPSLEWVLDQAETSVIRSGSRIVSLDPWNRLEAARDGRETETDYIGRCLRTVYNFAVDMNVHVQIVAHPAKSSGDHRRGDPPELEHIAGSKHWDNMVDQGFVVHRPQLFDAEGRRQTYTELHHKKARFDELGYATKFGLDYDIGVGRFGVCNLRQKKQQQAPDSNPPPHTTIPDGTNITNLDDHR